MKQYMIMITDGYVESQTLTNITLFCLVNDEDEGKITPTVIADRFRDIAHFCDNKEDLKNMFSWIMDTVGDFWELIEANGFEFSPNLNVPISKIIYIEQIIEYITDCNEKNFFNRETGKPYYFSERSFKV